MELKGKVNGDGDEEVEGENVELVDLVMENSKVMLDVCNQLYVIGLANKVKLPKIALLGDQSTGKSSVVESLSGINLPRGTGMVTRCPIIVSMLHRSENKILFESKEVKNEELDELILEKQNDLAGKNKNVSDTPIHIERHSPHVFDLTIIDLPGMVKNVSKGQPKDIEQQVENLVSKYIEDDNTIILVVIPAENDIQTVGAIKFAKKYDPEGNRTIGVMTKTDRQQEKMNVIDILEMRQVTMKLGIFATRNRSPEEREKGIPVTEARELEKRFFQMNYPDHADRCGIDIIARVLSNMLTERMKLCFPSLESEIRGKLRQCNEELVKLGQPVPKNEYEKRAFISIIVKNISDSIESLLRVGGFGDIINFTRSSEKKEHLLTGRIDIEFKKFGDEVRKGKPNFMSDDWRKNIEKLLKENNSGKLSGFLDYGVFCHILRDSICKIRSKGRSLLEKIKEMISDDIRKEVEKVCGRYKGLAAFFLQKLDDRIGGLSKAAGEEIEDQFEIELFVFTNNHYYANNVQKLIQKDITKQLKDQKNYELTNGRDSYLSRVEKFVLKRSNEEQMVKDMQIRLQSYYTVLMKRMMDNIPMRIEFSLIKKFKESVYPTLMNHVHTDRSIVKCIGESYGVQRKRIELQRDKEKFSEGLEVLKKAQYFF